MLRTILRTLHIPISASCLASCSKPLYQCSTFVACGTLATAVLLHALDVQKISDAVLLGLIVGVGFMASMSFTNAITPNMPRPMLFGAVVGSYHIVGAVLASIILYSI